MEEIRSLPSDIFSNLPRNVIETILTFLPIRDAVRTSILSRKWRYGWVNLPKLVFDDTQFQESREDQMSTKNKLALIIYQVLLLHQGPILEFGLSTSGLEGCSEIDQSILFLSRNGVEKLTLLILWGDKHYKLPSSFFSCLQLKHLNLHSCVFTPPPTFKGFSRLISLEFDEVIIPSELFGSFISSCLLLERLTLTSSASFDYLEINAPKLKVLKFRCLLKCIAFKAAPLLSNVSISLKNEEATHLKEGETSYLIELFSSLPVIENLLMGYHFLKSLAAGVVPKKLPTTLIHLKILGLFEICFGELDEVSCTLCLIRSSPNLQKFTISMFGSIDADASSALEFLKEQDYSDMILYRLKEVEIKCFSGTQPELEFIKLLLVKSPVLENMLIEPSSGNVADRLKMLQKLIRFQRASPKAEVVYEDPVPS